MNKNEINIINGTDYKEMTKALLIESGLCDLIGDKSKRIALKPNLVNASPASEGATTHPEVVCGIIEYLQENGFKNVCIMESSWVGELTSASVKACGYDTLSEKYSVPFYDMQKDESLPVNAKGMDLNICKMTRDIDFLINVPVIKGHCQTKVTCALKNMKGLIPNAEKRRFHGLGLHKPIAHVNAAIKQDFIVIDNICGDLDFEDGGHPVAMNRILTAIDPVLTDAFVCRLLNYEVSEVPYVGIAESLGVGVSDISTAKFNTYRFEDGKAVKYTSAQKDIYTIPSRPNKVVEVSDHVEEVESCSACYAYLIPALSRLNEEGLLPLLKDKICIGQGYRGKSGKLGIGNCTSGFEHHLKGCPPLEDAIYEFLKKYIEENEKGPH